MKTGDLYRFFDEGGELLYVGQSVDAVRRLEQNRAEKSWWDDVTRMDVERLPVEELAIAEANAIMSERPRHNRRRRHGQLAQAVSFRMRLEDQDRMLDAAANSGLPLGVWLRSVVVAHLDTTRPPADDKEAAS
jgi:hypothetical protein